MTAWLVGFLHGLPAFLLPWAFYRLWSTGEEAGVRGEDEAADKSFAVI